MPEAEDPPYLVGVVGPARRVIASEARAIRVAAGPGTGKSFAMMRRVARLLGDGVDPERIFVVTFTRTAARDLVESLRRLGVEGADRVRAGTLHSHCFSVLSREAVLTTTGRVPRPLMKFEERVLQEDLLHSQGFGIRQSREMLSAFDAAWARLQSEEPGWPRHAEERRFLQALMAWLRFHGGMLIGELIPEMRRYLRDNPGAEELRAFDHVLVDEYQDLNRADQDVIDRVSANGKLLVVGDEDQSIYTQLRHAQPEGIREFVAVRPHADDVPLDECRRCPESVVAVANHLIQMNSGREPRTLQAYPGNPAGTIEVIQWPTIEREATGLAEMIASAVAAGEVEPGDVLVLAPRRIIGYAVRDKLRELGISAHSYFGEEALDSDLAREGFTLLTLLAKPNDRVALRVWLSFGHSSRAAAPYARLRQAAEDGGISPRRALQDLASGALRLPHTKHLIDRFGELERRVAHLGELQGQALVDALFPEATKGLETVRSIACDALDASGDDASAQDLFEEVRNRIVQPELPAAGQSVRIMSLHKSKGLTADMCIIAGCVEGWIPGGGSSDEDMLREQRRLFYVGLTRARQTLVISHFEGMPLAEAHSMQVGIRRRTRSRAYCLASRFLAELGPAAPATESRT